MVELNNLRGYNIATANKGQLIGEQSMLFRESHNQNKRLYTGICLSEMSILLKMEASVFDLMMAESLKKSREMLATFIYQNIPGINTTYTYNKILQNAGHIFEQKTITKG